MKGSSVSFAPANRRHSSMKWKHNRSHLNMNGKLAAAAAAAKQRDTWPTQMNESLRLHTLGGRSETADKQANCRIDDISIGNRSTQKMGNKLISMPHADSKNLMQMQHTAHNRIDVARGVLWSLLYILRRSKRNYAVHVFCVVSAAKQRTPHNKWHRNITLFSSTPFDWAISFTIESVECVGVVVAANVSRGSVWCWCWCMHAAGKLNNLFVYSFAVCCRHMQQMHCTALYWHIGALFLQYRQRYEASNNPFSAKS